MLATHMNAEWIGSFLYSIIRISTPLIFASLGACFTKKAGLMNMALESMMLTAALCGVLCSGASHSIFVGFLGAVISAVMIAGIISYCAFFLKTDLYLTSISINLAAVGGTVFVLFLTCGQKSTSAGVINSLTIPQINIPIIENIPVIGPAISGHNLLTYIAFMAVGVVYFLLNETKTGLRIRSVAGAVASCVNDVWNKSGCSKCLADCFSTIRGGFRTTVYNHYSSCNCICADKTAQRVYQTTQACGINR